MIQQALVSVILLLLGINRKGWDATDTPGKAAITMAGWLYMGFAFFSVLGGIELIHGLTGSWWAGCTGGVLTGLMMANIVRLALITITVRISHHTKPEAAPAETPVPVNTRERIRNTWNGLKSRFHIAGFLRLLFIGLTAGAMSFPAGALLMRNTAGEILENRREQVIREFTERHTDYPQERLANYRTRINQEHFPIHVYIELAGHPLWLLFFLAVMSLAFLPYFFLWQQQGKGYFAVNDEHMRSLILRHYASTVDVSVKVVQRRFGPEKDVALMPHLAWENPPFNTIRKQPSETGWMTDEQWGTWLKDS